MHSFVSDSFIFASFVKPRYRNENRRKMLLSWKCKRFRCSCYIIIQMTRIHIFVEQHSYISISIKKCSGIVILFVGWRPSEQWTVNSTILNKNCNYVTVFDKHIFFVGNYSFFCSFLVVSLSWYLTSFILLWKMCNGLTLLVK